MAVTWIVAFREKKSHQIVGPLWFHECQKKPDRWARTACYDGCEYAIMSGQGYGWDKGVPERVLQRLEWFSKGTNDEQDC